MSRTMNNLKESFIIERYNNNNLHWKWRFYVTLYVCKVCCLKNHMAYNKPLINLDRLVITGKYQTSVFYVRTVKISVWYFPCTLG